MVIVRAFRGGDQSSRAHGKLNFPNKKSGVPARPAGHGANTALGFSGG
jgi:hypothetical protein